MLARIVSCVVTAFIALSSFSGCTTATKTGTQFWPAPPDPPRIQYLKAVSTSLDVVEKKSLSLLDLGNQEQEQAFGLEKPYGVAVKNGVIYVADTIQSTVMIFDLVGKKASVLKGNKGPGRLKKPINIAVDDDGFLYVADTVRRQVLKYGPDGEFLREIEEEKMKPVAVAVDDLYVYVLDTEQGLVSLYDRATSEPVRSFGQEGVPEARLFKPLAIGLDGKGGVYVTNLDGRIVHYDRDGHPIRKFGKLGTGLAEYNRPRAITFDREGVMYIVDAASQNVRLLNENFQLLMDFGTPGTLGSLNVPAGIAVSYDNLQYYQQLAEPGFKVEKVLFVVSQFGENKVSVYAMGKKDGVDYEAVLKGRMDEIRKREEAIVKAQREAKEKAEKEKAEKDKAEKDKAEKDKAEKDKAEKGGQKDPAAGAPAASLPERLSK